MLPTPRPPRPDRPDSVEVAALKQIKTDQPDLAVAVDLQLELVLLHRRVQGRIGTPWLEYDAAWLAAQQRDGRPILRFRDIPLEWSDLRLLCRQTADLLRRYDAIGREDYDRVQTMLRNANALQPLVQRWFESKIARADAVENVPASQPPLAEVAGSDVEGISDDALEQVFGLAMRPFLARCADVILQRIDVSGWTRAYCPLCGGDPEFAVITPAGERRLICGRCTAQWRFHDIACPFCPNDERQLVTSFASRDGRYRLYGCDVCRRYLKAYDARKSDRPVLLSVDSIATLPLDAAAIQKGYSG
jgi:hypothetical protein